MQLKANFKLSKNLSKKKDDKVSTNKNESRPLSKSEFEEFIRKSGATGSFMVYRSDKKDEELGLDEL